MNDVRFCLIPAMLLAITLLLSGCDSSSDEKNEPLPMENASMLKADVGREAPIVTDSDLNDYVADQTAFALWMHHQGVIATGANQNFLFSPLSISMAFALLWPGASGATADEIALMLHFSMTPERFHPAANRLDRILASRNEYEPGVNEGDAPMIEVVNNIWGLEEYPYEEAYLELLARHYGAGLWLVDFASDPESARWDINDYIAHRTRYLIPEILPHGAVTELTRLVLTNAIYFKGAWRCPFAAEKTQDKAFTTISGTISDVPMMSGIVQQAAYANVDGAEAVELLYVGNDLSMVLILPDENTFSDFEAALDPSRLSTIMEELEPMPGAIQMPRFRFDTELNLGAVFQAAGFTLPFTEGVADFSGISRIAVAENLHISGAFHKATIDVDEEGTEAAAATAISVGITSTPADTFNVHLNRPFLFVIRDRPTNAILFMGRVVDAAAAL